MWDVYSQSKNVRLPLFWREAFEAAYEDLTSEDSNVRDAAISEIAKMSLVRSTLKHQLEPTTVKSRYIIVLHFFHFLSLKLTF